MGESGGNVFLYRTELAGARAALRAGKNIRIRGTRQSGMSTLLREITLDSEAAGLEVIEVRGDHLAQHQPGRVLEEVRAALGLHRRSRHLGESIDEVAQELSPESVLCIDDPHLADAQSLRTLHVIRCRLGLRTVIAERIGEDRDSDFPPVWPETTIELAPMDLATTGAVMRDILGGPILPGSVVRVYGKTGGVVGTTVALVESARDRGLLRLHNGVWKAQGRSLWSADLLPFVDSLLLGCSDELKALLWQLSRTGPQSLDALVDTVPMVALEEGINRGLISPVRGQSGMRYQVWPSIYVERFRHSPTYGIHGSAPGVSRPSLPGSFSPARGNNVATLARAFSEHSSLVLGELYEAWEKTRGPVPAAKYLDEALGIDSESERIERVMNETRATLRSPSVEELGFVIHLATWALVEREDAVAAREHLDTLAMFSPQLSGSVESIWAMLGALHGDGAPSENFSEHQDPFGFSVAARAAGALMRGSLSAARSALAEMAAHPWLRDIYVYLQAAALLLSGDPIRALDFISEEREAAIASFDRQMFATLSYAAAVIHFYMGDARAANTAVEEGLVVGRPGLAMTPVYAAMLNFEAMAAHFRGQKTIRDDLIQSAAHLSAATGPFLGAGVDAIEIIASAEQSLKTVDAERDLALVDAIQVRCEQGYIIGAVQLAMAILVLDFSKETAGALIEAEKRTEETIYRRPASLVAALVAEDISLIAQILAEEPTHHDRNLRTRLVTAAARRANKEGRGEIARKLFSITEPTHAGDQKSGVSEGQSPLSKREAEVARLAVTMSNPEIAMRLGLSRRTVENHVANALRKTSLRNRRELAEFVEQN
ncbi:hypothetical protein CRE_07125 [Caenorhabditis remanei]|uniref:HTH luxR-type domain-containing protein n=1 Tax=Caenorhabditis remanei TaxID=31234 RepID=E3NPA9_CAERE|nr:hypothetical protein CRE_07125 [Caenorhabditis remanei]